MGAKTARLISYGMNDGPVPEHYEPFESPADNQMNGSQNSPCIRFAEYESVKKGDRSQYPIAVTTYSVTEHWQTGGQTRCCPALLEASPEQFIEMSEELAAEKGIANGDLVRVFNNRGSVKVHALVTPRFKPFTVNGQTVHQVGMTHHFGWAGEFGTGRRGERPAAERGRSQHVRTRVQGVPRGRREGVREGMRND